MPDNAPDFPFFVIGNKCDLVNDRAVSKEKVEEFIIRNPDIIYFETSAMDGSNVNEVFNCVASNHIRLQKRQDEDSQHLNMTNETD